MSEIKFDKREIKLPSLKSKKNTKFSLDTGHVLETLINFKNREVITDDMVAEFKSKYFGDGAKLLKGTITSSYSLEEDVINNIGRLKNAWNLNKSFIVNSLLKHIFEENSTVLDKVFKDFKESKF